MWWREIVALLFVKSLGAAFIRLLIALGLATVVVEISKETGEETDKVRIHPIVLMVLGLASIIAWIATIGSFIIALIELIKDW